MAMTRPRPKVMTLTDAAAERVKAIMVKASKPALALRLGVKNGGCAGMEYTMEWAEHQRPHDEVVEDHGVRIFIDPKAILFLLGTEMDYKQSMLKSGKSSWTRCTGGNSIRSGWGSRSTTIRA